MRPLDKGPAPKDGAGNVITVNDYDRWRRYLIERIGYYCAYCNISLSHSLQVEHVVPKDPPPGYQPGDPLAWDNMLLACGPCNRAKWNTPIDFNNYYFPENCNTLLPFSAIESQQVSMSAIVTCAAGLSPIQTTRALSTIKLMELDRIDERDDIVDVRHIKRRDSLTHAELLYDLYQEVKRQHPTLLMRMATAVALAAKSSGFFGIWFRKFENESQALAALLDPTIIPGTAQNCFDHQNNFAFLHRNPGNPTDTI